MGEEAERLESWPMKNPEFRDATEDDFSRIREIALKGWLFSYSYLPSGELRKLVNEYYSGKNLKMSLKKVKAGTDSFVVVEMVSKVIGFCHVTVKKMKGELLRLYIDTDYIGKGIGKKLLLKCEEFLMSKGCRKYFTFANMHNKIGMDFYLRNGFVRLPEKDKEDEFRNGKVLWHMEKEL